VLGSQRVSVSNVQTLHAPGPTRFHSEAGGWHRTDIIGPFWMFGVQTSLVGRKAAWRQTCES
jgi:hypothetical protein